MGCSLWLSACCYFPTLLRASLLPPEEELRWSYPQTGHEKLEFEKQGLQHPLVSKARSLQKSPAGRSQENVEWKRALTPNFREVSSLFLIFSLLVFLLECILVVCIHYYDYVCHKSYKIKMDLKYPLLKL